MPWEEGTLTPEDVAAELGIPVDERVTVATDAARAWGQALAGLTLPDALWSDAARHRGGVLEGCYQYIRRADPAGMPAFEDYAANPFTLHLDAERALRPDPASA